MCRILEGLELMASEFDATLDFGKKIKHRRTINRNNPKELDFVDIRAE